MAVDLEELAIKSIEQYAGINVRLQSIEQALIDQNRKNELRDDKVSAVNERLTRIDENLIRDMKEKTVINNKINEIQEGFEELTATVNIHRIDRCDGCKNEKAIDVLKKDIAIIKDTDKDLKEVRDLVTSPWGLTFLRFITSRMGQIFIAAICIDIIVDIIMHYEILKIFWKLITFSY
jgi:DNA repair exonuclease SbcCD ATPase subunit